MANTSLRERVMIRELSEDGFGDRQIGLLLQLSLHTVRKWRRRLAKDGKAGLNSRMGRPRCGAMGTYPEAMRELVRRWRGEHPGWGPKTLSAELHRWGGFQGHPIASRSAIVRFLKQEGLAKKYEKHVELPGRDLSPTQACHEEWEMDARGQERLAGLGIISLIQVNDVFSRTKLISYPCWLGDQRLVRYPATEDYQLILRLAFTEWGLPDRLAVDRAHVFYDAQGKSPFPTRFHLWLLALGVEVTFGRPGQPRDQAVTERSHQTWWHQLVEGQTFADYAALRTALAQRRGFLNENLPCETLANLPPLVAHPQARVPRRIYRPEWEADLIDLERVYAYLSRCHWFRRVSKVGTVSLSRHNYSLGKAWYACEVEVNFDPQDLCFVFHAPPRPDKRLPLRWLSVQSLMGEAGAVANLPAFQLALPISWDDWRTLQTRQLLSVRLCETLGDTT
jgi:transposase